VAASIESQVGPTLAPRASLHERLNGPLHRPALRLFMVVVLGHWAEHLAQAVQIYVLGWPLTEARGVLGLWYPWLVKSELLHYLYALVMLVGLWTLRKGFHGLSYKWWTAALVIQFWHHVEHALLIGQALSGHNLFGSPVPSSIVQLLIPRVELHLFYNTVVFIPMIIGMYYHVAPPEGEEPSRDCSCALRRGTVKACAV
jgi:hypothetical protein